MTRTTKPRPKTKTTRAERVPTVPETVEALLGKQARAFEAVCADEPDLIFMNGERAPDPKAGIIQFGPFAAGEGQAGRELCIGIIGTGEDVQSAQQWLSRCGGPIDSELNLDDPRSSKLPFPGVAPTEGFRCRLVAPEDLTETLTQTEIRRCSKATDRDSAVEALVEAVHTHLETLSERERRPDVVLVALPTSLRKSVGGARTRARPTSEPTKKMDVRQMQLPGLFPASPAPRLSRTLHRAIKAEAMRFQLPVQVAWSTTFSGGLGIQDEATRAWNFCTALYYKAGMVPWRVVGLRKDTCYVGISFFQPIGEPGRMQTSMAQAFSDRGDGTVLRGASFPWDIRSQGSPHLTRQSAHALMENVIAQYEKHHSMKPARVVVHKSSYFTEDEQAGMEEAFADRVPYYDLVSFAPSSIRFLRLGQEPPIRGTMLRIARDRCVVYTNGYVPYLDKYPGPHIPVPLEISHVQGSSGVQELVREILALTRMNWNSADFASSVPITLRFSRQVGLILSELPKDIQPNSFFRYYM